MHVLQHAFKSNIWNITIWRTYLEQTYLKSIPLIY